MHIGSYTPFPYRGLVDFLILAEEQVDFLGDTSWERSSAASQLVNTILIAPAEEQQLLLTMVERNQIGHHQMKLLFAENPQAERYK